MAHDQLSRNPQHPVAEPRELPIPPRISNSPQRVTATIYLNDKPKRRCDKIGDVAIPDDDLLAERNAEAPAAQLAPE